MDATTLTKLDKKKMLWLKAYAKNFCNKSETCRKVKVNPKTVYRWIESDPLFAEAIKQLEEEEIYEAERVLKREAFGKKKVNMTGLIFFLKNRHPNYADKLKVEGDHRIKLDDHSADRIGEWLKRLDVQDVADDNQPDTGQADTE